MTISDPAARAGRYHLPFTPTQPGQFRESFERAPFLFEHALAGHPLFSLDALRSLAFRLAADPGRVYYDSGDVRVSQKWGRIPVSQSLGEALDGIESTQSWIILKSVNLDPEYAPLLDGCIEQVSELTGRPLAKEIGKRIMSVLISSPDRVTPYHIDGESNFLLQSQGSKIIYVFDGTDRSILTQEEIERFWNADKTAAQYREAVQAKAQAFELKPGLGVHVPLLFPHWVKNGPEVSVSISVNFEFADTRLPDLYRANYYLRRMGLQPQESTRLPLVNGLKIGAFRTFNALRNRKRA